MRILPLVTVMKNWPIEDRFVHTQQVSSITHAHIRSVIACFYYLEFARLLLLGYAKIAAYQQLQNTLAPFLRASGVSATEIAIFDRLLKGNIATLTHQAIHSSGYVVHTLEASIWCLLTTHTFESAVLQAVNLGNDTDTTGAVTGGLAAMVYGVDAIPTVWLAQLAQYEAIGHLAQRWQAFQKDRE